MKRSTTKTKTPVSTYVAVGKNVYYDGSSYRTRVSVNGRRYSKSFPNKKQAIDYRNKLLVNN